MALFDKARGLWKGGGSSESSLPIEPQSYEVTCPEGHTLRGMRTESYQAVRCPECGSGLFILPESPLPLPPAPEARARKQVAEIEVDDGPIPLTDPIPVPRRPVVDDVDDDEQEYEDGGIQWVEDRRPAERSSPAPPVEIPWQEEVAEAKARPAPKPARQPAAKPSAKPAEGERAPVAAPRPAPAPAPDEPRVVKAPGARVIVVNDAGRRGGRVGWLIAGVAAVVLVTGFLFVRRQWSADYVQQVEIGRLEGIPALEQGDFDRANALLSRAAVAANSLRGEISGADEIRQAAKEAAIFVDLVPDTLETILDEFARSGGDEQWTDRFRRLYQGRAVLFESGLTAADAGGVELAYRVLAPGPTGPRVGRIDLAGLEVLSAEPPRPGSTLRLGARLQAIEADPVTRDWVFRLAPDSGVIITHIPALEALGWTTPDLDGLGLNPVRPERQKSTSSARLHLAQAVGGAGRPIDSVIDLSRDQVVERLGSKPQSVARSASQGYFIEQWTFADPRGRRFVNFLQAVGRSEARAVGSFVLP